MNVLICVAWPNASGPRHLGHAAGCYLPADVVARYHRVRGDDVLVVSGSDCHGTPVTVAAERAGAEPDAFAHAQHDAIAATFVRLGLDYDVYTTTTTATHEREVHDFFGRLRAHGFVAEALQESASCTAERRSLPDRYVEGTCPHCGATDARGDQCDACARTLDPADLRAPRCLRCGAPAELRGLRQLLVRLDLLQPHVERFLDTREGWRGFVLNEARGWVREGLRPRAITRDLPWGVRVPLDGWDDRRFYVWFEDVIGYRSACAEHDPERWEAWWGPDVRHRYFIGKDNIPFHAVWWPALLAGAGVDHLPDDVVANHHLTFGDRKASASRGVGVTIDDGLDRIGADALRHALCALNPETADVEFTWEQADDLTRTGLLGAIANPVHRVATLLWKRFEGRPAPGVDVTAERAAASRLLDDIGHAYERSELREALRGVWEAGRTINRRLAATEPWHLPDADAHAELTRLLPWLDAVGVGAWPVVPDVGARVRKTLGLQPRPTRWRLDEGLGRVVSPPRPVLDRIAVAVGG